MQVLLLDHLSRVPVDIMRGASGLVPKKDVLLTAVRAGSGLLSSFSGTSCGRHHTVEEQADEQGMRRMFLSHAINKSPDRSMCDSLPGPITRELVLQPRMGVVVHGHASP